MANTDRPLPVPTIQINEAIEPVQGNGLVAQGMIKYDVESLATLGVDKVRKEIGAHLDRLGRRLRDAKKEVAAVEEEYAQAVKALAAPPDFVSKVGVLVAAMQAFTPRAGVALNGNGQPAYSFDTHTGDRTFSVEIEVRDGNRGDELYTAKKAYAMPTAVTAILDRLKGAHERQAAVESKLLALRERRAALPELRESMKAAIVAQQLEASGQDGRDLLTSIRNATDAATAELNSFLADTEAE